MCRVEPGRPFGPPGPCRVGPTPMVKIFLYNTLLATVRSRCDIALAMASSGIAALLLQGGITVHSRLKVPIRLNEISMCGISKQTVLAKLTMGNKDFATEKNYSVIQNQNLPSTSEFYVTKKIIFEFFEIVPFISNKIFTLCPQLGKL